MIQDLIDEYETSWKRVMSGRRLGKNEDGSLFHYVREVNIAIPENNISQIEEK
jgi:hypothetical protein